MRTTNPCLTPAYYPAPVDLTPTHPGVLAVLAVIGLVLAVVAVGLAAWLHLQPRRLRRSYRVLWPGGEGDVATLVGDQHRRLARLAGDVAAARAEVAVVSGDVSRSLRHVAVVRYDAFGDMGGRLSLVHRRGRRG